MTRCEKGCYKHSCLLSCFLQFIVFTYEYVLNFLSEIPILHIDHECRKHIYNHLQHISDVTMNFI